MISAEDLGGLLFGIHHHAKVDGRDFEIVYKEDDIIKLLYKLGFPEPVWGKSLNIDDYFPKAYDPTFGDDKKCVCGHAYYRHFDTYEDMRPIGCKYCECDTFKLDNHDMEVDGGSGKLI